MGARAISSGTISFGLVSIPVKLYTAASSEQVRFNMLHRKCGGRLKMQYYCPVDDEVVERGDIVKGYEYARGQYVRFDDEELKSLEAEKSNSIEIVEFVPLDTFDLIQVERSYYLGPDKGGDKAYRLLGEAMREKNRVAVGRWASRGKEQLVVIRPYRDGLLFHQLYYADEVRAFDDIDTGATFQFSDVERELAQKLIDQLSSDELQAEKYHDSFRERVQQAVDQKVAGEQVTVAPEAPRAHVIDLFEALKQSLAKEGAKEGPPLKPPKKAKETGTAAEGARPRRGRKRSAS
ncbi:MAG: Ku protein [Myxococcales bacterium]|jgi:DNA end-binding protein Ku|nr:Ku protein [Myxococcales bacterium]